MQHSGNFMAEGKLCSSAQNSVACGKLWTSIMSKLVKLLIVMSQTKQNQCSVHWIYLVLLVADRSSLVKWILYIMSVETLAGCMWMPYSASIWAFSRYASSTSFGFSPLFTHVTMSSLTSSTSSSSSSSCVQNRYKLLFWGEIHIRFCSKTFLVSRKCFARLVAGKQ